MFDTYILNVMTFVKPIKKERKRLKYIYIYMNKTSS